MSSRTLGQFVAGGVIGVGLAIAAGFLGFGININFGDTATGIVLGPGSTGDPCAIASKQPTVVVAKGKKITWDIWNGCEAAQTVTLGNFRTLGSTGPSDCANPTAGGATYPFTKDTLAARQDSAGGSTGSGNYGKGHITLKVASTATEGTYDYDMCLGAGNGVKADPQLIIER
jgi:hypothetical protein